MNRKQRGDFVRKIITQVREKEYPYEGRPKGKINWNDYDVAQCREIADMIELIRALADSAVDHIEAMLPQGGPKRPGRPPRSASDITKVLLLQSYLGVPNRVAEGLLYLFSEKLGLTEEFSYKTIERGYDRESVDRILTVVFTLTNKPVRELEKVFSADGSGTPTSMKQNYAEDRERQNRRRTRDNDTVSETMVQETASDDRWPVSTYDLSHGYVYKVAVIGTRYKLFAGWKSTVDHSVGETSMFPEVMAQAIEHHPHMNQILGDGIFATRPICKIVSEYKVTPRFLPRRNVTLKRRGVKAWIDMLWALSEDPQKWLNEYHMRSISETGFSMITRANPQPLRKRLDPRKETEDFLRAVCHNIKRLCYLKYLAGIVPVFSEPAG